MEPAHMPGTTLITLPFDSGLSAKRNALVSRTTEPYILILDDDYIFTGQTKPERLLTLLKATGADLAAGSVEDRAGFEGALEERGRTLLMHRLRKERDPYEGVMGLRYAEVDVALNFFLAQRSLLEDVSWNEELKLAEHIPFFYEVWQVGGRCVWTPDVHIGHDPDHSGEYSTYRRRSYNFKKKALEMYDLKEWKWTG